MFTDLVKGWAQVKLTKAWLNPGGRLVLLVAAPAALPRRTPCMPGLAVVCLNGH